MRVLSTVRQNRRKSRRNGIVAPATTERNWLLYSPADPFPARWKATLQFSQRSALTVATASAFGTESVYRLNSIFAPTFTPSATEQPYGYDQMSPLYERYIVRAVTINIQFTDPSADGLVVAAMVQPASGSQTLSGKSIAYPHECPGCIVANINNTGEQLANFRKRFTIAQIEGLSERDLVSTSSLYSAEIDASPTLCPWLRLAVASYNSTDTTSTVRYTVTLSFEVELYNRVYLDSS